jgi:serine protease inhibitor
MTIRFNRPFIFAIWEHHSGSLLFLGKLVEPSND